MQLDLFYDVLRPIPIGWDEWRPQVGGLVNCDFQVGLDLISGQRCCYTGGSYGQILALNDTKAIVHFPAHPTMPWIEDEWFEMDVYSFDFGPVCTFGFNEEAYRATRIFKQVPERGAGIEYWWCGKKYIY